MVDRFIETQRTQVSASIPVNVSSLSELKTALPNCSACSICSKATAPVMGEGPMDAEIVFVGEQPGAAQSVFGNVMEVHESRGRFFQTSFCDYTVILPHPSAILRTQDAKAKMKMFEQFIADIAGLKDLLEVNPLSLLPQKSGISQGLFL
jgi:uracil-DNA glycosylase